MSRKWQLRRSWFPSSPPAPWEPFFETRQRLWHPVPKFPGSQAASACRARRCFDERFFIAGVGVMGMMGTGTAAAANRQTRCSGEGCMRTKWRALQRRSSRRSAARPATGCDHSSRALSKTRGTLYHEKTFAGQGESLELPLLPGTTNLGVRGSNPFGRAISLFPLQVSPNALNGKAKLGVRSP
jgi:hypothetical protein